jgi:CRISPR type III-B/RAMP module RAMP protein Cmr6
MNTATSATALAAPVLRAIAPLVAAGKIESASLRHGKLVRTLENATKRGEIEAVATAHKNHRRAIPALTPAGAETIFAKTAARLIVNQAGGILENAGLSLHRHFNDPIIPGSAVKGTAAHAAWCEWNEAAAGEAKERIARDYATVFGFPTTDRALDTFLTENCGFKPSDATAGAIAFLPAVPHTKPALTVEITNSHHMKYYGSDNPNAVALDNEEPNPQFFPAIEIGAVFRFTLVPLKKAGAATVVAQVSKPAPSNCAIPQADLKTCATTAANLLALAKRWLLAALTVGGVGAKTAAGYGWFEDVTEKTLASERAVITAAATAAAEKAKLAALSPLERAKAELAKLDDQAFAEKCKTIATLSEDEQRALIRLFSDQTPEGKAKREKLKNWRKKKPGNVKLLETAAANLNEKLP